MDSEKELYEKINDIGKKLDIPFDYIGKTMLKKRHLDDATNMFKIANNTDYLRKMINAYLEKEEEDYDDYIHNFNEAVKIGSYINEVLTEQQIDKWLDFTRQKIDKWSDDESDSDFYIYRETVLAYNAAGLSSVQIADKIVESTPKQKQLTIEHLYDAYYLYCDGGFTDVNTINNRIKEKIPSHVNTELLGEMLLELNEGHEERVNRWKNGHFMDLLKTRY